MSIYANEMSNDAFAQARDVAIANEPGVKQFSLNQISLTDESVTQEHVMIDGHPVSVNPSFFKGLAKILNVNDKLIRSIKGRNDSGEGIKFLNHFMEALKTYQASKNASQVWLVGDPSTEALTNIVSGEYNRMSNADLFKVAERLLNDYSHLQLKNIQQHGPDCEIQMLSNKDIGFGHLDAVNQEEVFNFGFTVNNSGTSTSLGDFAYRLVCANGMMGMQSNMNFVLGNNKSNNLNRFFNHIQEAAARDFLPEEFATNLAIANKVPASLHEVEKAYGGTSIRIDEQEENIKQTYDMQLRKQHLWGLDKTKARLIGKNIDPSKLKDKEKSYINSGMKVWDLVNALTFIGSGNSTIPFRDQTHMVKAGGKQFAAEYDLMYSQLYKL